LVIFLIVLRQRRSHQEEITREVLYPRCCGIDVHKTFVQACLKIVESSGHRRKEMRRLSTLTCDLVDLVGWLQANRCTHVAMESTGVFWKPVYNLLEGHFEVLRGNAQPIKAVPGRKTDVKDAEGIADLLQHGLLKGSFIPTTSQREVRDLTRLRITLLQERARLINRVQKLLEDGNVKLSIVISDVRGVSGRAILAAMIQGCTDPEQLALLAHGRLRAQPEQIKKALQGHLKDHHRLQFKECFTLMESLERTIEHLDREIAERLRPYDALIQRLDAIPGLGRRNIEVLLAEIGCDRCPFAKATQLASWVGICPGNDESAGKRLKGTIRKGNRWVKTTLVQAAHAAGRTETYLGEQYRRLSKRRGSKRAAVAVGHSILVIVYHLIKTGEASQEKGGHFFEELDQQRQRQRLVAQLEHLGYQVSLQPAPPIA
jgi:transposase